MLTATHLESVDDDECVDHLEHVERLENLSKTLKISRCAARASTVATATRQTDSEVARRKFQSA